jgi:hypothetical protein
MTDAIGLTEVSFVGTRELKEVVAVEVERVVAICCSN